MRRQKRGWATVRRNWLAVQRKLSRNTVIKVDIVRLRSWHADSQLLRALRAASGGWLMRREQEVKLLTELEKPQLRLRFGKWTLTFE